MKAFTSANSVAMLAGARSRTDFSAPSWTWAILLVVLLVCLPPLVMDLGVRDSTHTMENVSLLTAQEAWLRYHAGESYAWWFPSSNGTARTAKPPMLVWLDMLAWSDLTPATSTTKQLTERARLVTVALALVLLASTFWIGLTLGDRELAVLATLVAGSMFFLQRQGRTASYDMHLTAWATLAVASALWAMRPFQTAPAAARNVVGWTVAGLALALAWMSKGPLSLALVCMPVLGAIALVPGRRLANLLGLGSSVALAAALVAPWFISLFLNVSNSEKRLLVEYSYPLRRHHPFYYYIGLLGLVVPWTIWLVAGLFYPFKKKSTDERRRLLVPWLWFVLIFVMFSIAECKQQRYILPIIPAAALVVAQVWRDHERIAERGQLVSGIRRLRGPHWLSLTSVSLLMGLFVALQSWLVARGWLPQEQVAAVPWPAAMAVTAALTALAVLGWRWHLEWKPMRAAIMTAGWAMLACTLGWHIYAYAPSGVHPIKAQAERVARLVGEAPLRYLKLSNADLKPNEEFLFYARRIVPPVEPEELANYSQRLGNVYVMANAAEEYDAALGQAGFSSITDFEDDHTADPHLLEHTIAGKLGQQPTSKVKIVKRRLWVHTAANSTPEHEFR